jgi:sugar phosphate permease
MTIKADRLIGRAPFFYGWIILAGGTVGIVFTSPGQTAVVSVFVEHLIRDLEISRSLVSTLYSGGSIAAALLLPVIGSRIDRHGPRLMMAVTAALLAAFCVFMSQVQGAAMLFIGFWGLRLFGQGSLSLASGTAINLWWVRRRGAILGISGFIAAILMNGFFPPWIQYLNRQFDWRTAYTILGVAVAAVVIPAALLFIRNRPEAYGLEPDGQKVENPVLQDDYVEVHWTRPQALRSSAFWLISGSYMSISMLFTGLAFHLVSILGDGGIPEEMVGVVFVASAISTALFTVLGGYLSDRIRLRYLIAIAQAGMGIALIVASTLSSQLHAVGFGILLGSVGGIGQVVQAVSYANYFGRRHLGSIAGFATTMMVFAAALGPMPMGIARDLLGSYGRFLPGLAIIPFVIGLIVLLKLKKPQLAQSST